MKPDGALLAQAFTHGQEAFVAVDGPGSIVLWNLAAEQLFGYSAAEALGRPLAALFFPDESATFAATASPWSGVAEDRIQRLRHRSGRELRVTLRQVHLAASQGKASLLLSAVDIGGRERAEENLEGSRLALAASRSELRRVAARRVAAEEEARRRVARELHDDLGQRVTAAALELKAVRRQIPDADARRTDLDAVGGHLAELAEDLRRLSHELHPSTLERRGLAEALSDHCAEVEKRTGLAVRLSLSNAEVPIDANVALGLYRIAQEALANVARHARARTVHVTLTVNEGAMQLAVADDGVGFDPKETSGGLGLASIEERADLLGGQFRIASAPGAGAEIEVTVPLGRGPSEPGQGPDPGGLPRQIGPYRLLEEIGRGAVTTVYLAQEPEPLGRKVAVKLHKSPLPGRPETLRFKAEQQALARLHHPAIAEVYEARTTPEGDPYIVMEYVPGLSITEYCDRYGLDLSRRLELFAAVCGGVQHAHRKGILHRALEPSNLRVTEDGGVALPKILDFGVAKGLDRPLAESTVWTLNERVSDLAYLAPETLRGGEVDALSEVYSLGAVLYELLAGVVPIEGVPGGIAARLERGGAPRSAVPTLSERLRAMEIGAATEVARRRGLAHPARLRRRLAGDLDRIARKALAEDPAARYPTVEALCREVQRVLSGEPVEAGVQGTLPRLGRFVRRHQRFAAAATVVAMVLLGGLIASAREARRNAEEASRADAVAQFLEELFRASDPRQAKGAPPGVRDLLRRGTERLGSALRDQPLLRARLLDSLGGIHTDLGLYDRARPLLAEALALRESQGGKEDLEVAATLVRLGSLAHLSGKGEAVPLFSRALAIREKRLGEESPEVADVLNKLGVAFAARGKLDEAEKILRRSLDLSERLWGENDPRVAKVLHNLSGIAIYRGETAQGERLLERALAIREKALPPDDLDLAGSREALALLRLQEGRPAEAAAQLERLVATAEKVYGPGHVEYARPLLNLGLARRDLGQDADAAELFERALAICDQAVAPDHPLAVRALATLADHHFAHQRYAQAEPLYRRLVRLHRAGAVLATWNDSLDRFARLLRITGREAEAAEVPVAAYAAGADGTSP
ncbi:MAG TPA: tetratricopeptide repeat protein [Thermoanaerobaculia bacterium]|nr:tetratricopeptide repeat protein [Thermoanaerobaculia bacterium]